MIANEVPAAIFNGNLANLIKAGTSKNPPPTPRNPARMPVIRPAPKQRTGLHSGNGRGSEPIGLNMRTATNPIKAANTSIRASGESKGVNREPSTAPTAPDTPNIPTAR
jgi:hypothetical protein